MKCRAELWGVHPTGLFAMACMPLGEYPVPEGQRKLAGGNPAAREPPPDALPQHHPPQRGGGTSGGNQPATGIVVCVWVGE